MEAKQTVKAFINAVRSHSGRAKDVIFHSDQEVQLECTQEEAISLGVQAVYVT